MGELSGHCFLHSVHISVVPVEFEFDVAFVFVVPTSVGVLVFLRLSLLEMAGFVLLVSLDVPVF